MINDYDKFDLRIDTSMRDDSNNVQEIQKKYKNIIETIK